MTNTKTHQNALFLAANFDRAVLSHLGELCAPFGHIVARGILRKLVGNQEGAGII